LDQSCLTSVEDFFTHGVLDVGLDHVDAVLAPALVVRLGVHPVGVGDQEKALFCCLSSRQDKSYMVPRFRDWRQMVEVSCILCIPATGRLLCVNIVMDKVIFLQRSSHQCRMGLITYQAFLHYPCCLLTQQHKKKLQSREPSLGWLDAERECYFCAMPTLKRFSFQT